MNLQKHQLYSAHPNKFTYPIQVHKEDIDHLGHVNNVVYLRWVQEVAIAHWETVAPLKLKQDYNWVIIRHEIDYHKSAHLEDDIIAYTWTGTQQGVKSERIVCLHRASDNHLLASAKTIWCLLDARTNRPKRLKKDILEIL